MNLLPGSLVLSIKKLVLQTKDRIAHCAKSVRHDGVQSQKLLGLGSDQVKRLIELIISEKKRLISGLEPQCERQNRREHPSTSRLEGLGRTTGSTEKSRSYWDEFWMMGLFCMGLNTLNN